MITQDQFRSATTAHKLIDAHGRQWDILEVDPRGEFPKLRVQCPDHPEELITFDPSTGNILDCEEWAIIVELNHADATIKIP